MSFTDAIFVDFENIREIDLHLIQGKPVKVFIFVGKRHSTIPEDLLRSLTDSFPQVELIAAQCSGKNALDFILAYQIGVESVKNPQKIFHILSRDQGFDALVLHLEAQKISVTRHESFKAIPILGGIGAIIGKNRESVQESNQVTVKDSAQIPLRAIERIEDMRERFSRNLSRPRRKDTLFSHIHIRFGKKLSEIELQEIVDGLVNRRVIEIDSAGTVHYYCS